MPRYSVSPLSLFSVCFLSITATTLMLGKTAAAGPASYLAAGLGALAALPFCLLLLRLHNAYPQESPSGLLRRLFGAGFARFLLLFYAFLSLLTGAILFSYLTRFISLTGKTEQTAAVFTLLLMLTVFLVAKAGIDKTARFCRLLLPFIALILLTGLLLLLSAFDIRDLLPFPGASGENLVLGSLSMFFYPFSQIFLCVPFLFRTDPARASRPLLLALLCSGLVIFFSYALTAGVLGAPCLALLRYPYYMALSAVEISPFFRRVEVILSVHFILSMIVKGSVCTEFSSLALSSAFPAVRPERLSLPLAALITGLSLILFSDAAQMLRALDFYPFLVAPFFVLLPLAALLRHLILKKRS